MTNYQVLIDSDAFVGLLCKFDSNHLKSKKIFSQMEKKRMIFVTTSYVILEVSIVLSHKVGQKLAKEFINMAKNFSIIHIDNDLSQAGLEIFLDQNKKGTSVTDCTNVAVMKKFGITKIFSFNKFYAKNFPFDLLTLE